MNTKELLEGIGLSKGEVKVYFALLELGSSTTGQIIKRAKVSRSKVYEMLDRLMQRGLVSFVIKENTKYFEAANPEEILAYVSKQKKKLEEKETQLKKSLPELKAKQKSAKKPQSAKVYEGLKGIKTMYNELLNEMKKGDEYFAVAVEPEVYEGDFLTFIQNYHKRRAEKGVKVKLLAHNKIKRAVQQSIAKTKLLQARYFSQSAPSATLIYKDDVATFVWSDNPTAIVISSQTIAKRYKSFFEELWNGSKV